MTDERLIELIMHDSEIKEAVKELILVLAGFALPIRSALLLEYLGSAKNGKA